MTPAPPSLRRRHHATGAAALLALLACNPSTFDGPMTFGDRVVPVATLERGKDLYNRYCATCHGYSGRADTPQARQLDPRPSDLSLAQFKRVETPGGLPSDAELGRIITNGIPGTGMPPWPQLQGTDLDAVIQYLKTFSPRWRSALPPAPRNDEKGSMKALPATRTAASFRAADDLGFPNQGMGTEDAQARPAPLPSGGLTSTNDSDSLGLDGLLRTTMGPTTAGQVARVLERNR
jgi:mono/diheme cytochrome c family protein